MSIDRNSNGNRYVVFKPALGLPHTELSLPCGQCIGCRLEYSRQWAVRCVHEASLYESNCFITLTYNDDYVPSDGSLVRKHFTDFMKRLRKAVTPKNPHVKGSDSYKLHAKKYGIRFFGCGEYGVSCLVCGKNEIDCNKDLSHAFVETFGRPHFHACIFNYDFPDKVQVSSKNGFDLYTSEVLQNAWSDPATGKPLGFVSIGSFSFESAAYVARYVTKKINGDAAASHYFRIDPISGESVPISPEFPLMSRRGGIASEWWEQFNGDLDKDYLTLRGSKMRPARFYDYLLHKVNPEELLSRKKSRKLKAIENSDNSTRRRLDDREFIVKRRSTKLKRGL